MSAVISCHPMCDATEVFPGTHAVDPSGAKLAVQMLLEFRRHDSDAAGVSSRDYMSLEDWPRQGRPFRNIVFEYLQRVRELGIAAEVGFCAVLSDFTMHGADTSSELVDMDAYIQSYVEGGT